MSSMAVGQLTLAAQIPVECFGCRPRPGLAVKSGCGVRPQSMRGTHSEGIFLLDKRGKHLIAGREGMARYDFDENNVIVAPQIVLDSIPAGEYWL